MKKMIFKFTCLTFASILLLSGCNNAAKFNDVSYTGVTDTQSTGILSTGNSGDSNSEENDIMGLYDYYSLLDAESQKYGIGSGLELREGRFMHLRGTNKIVRVFDTSDLKIEIFDINTGEWSTIKFPHHFGEQVYYNGKIYCAYDDTSWNSFTVLTCDQDIQSAPADQLTFTLKEERLTEDEHWGWNTLELRQILINTDGDIILVNRARNDIESKCIHWVSADLEEKKHIDAVTNIETDDGKTIEMEILTINGFYKNKLFAGLFPTNKDNIEYSGSYILDIDTMKWRKSEFKGSVAVGRYLVSAIGIYDMEDEKYIFYNDELAHYDAEEGYYVGHILSNNYYGGKYCIELKDNKWYFVQYPSKGSDVIYNESQSYEIPEDLSDEDNKVTALSDKYYLISNKSGTFVRTYEGGKNGEVKLR